MRCLIRPERGRAIPNVVSGALLGTALALALSIAGPAQAQPLERAGMAGLATSERLRLYTLTRALESRRAPPPVTQAARQALTAQAFYHDVSRPAVIRRDIRLNPVLAWDANINGGFLNDQFNHFGLVFQVDPARVAKAGLVAGARMASDVRLAYGPGRFLELQTQAEAVWSPRHEIGRASGGVSVCARNHVSGWTFADFCASRQGSWRALSDSRSSTTSATVSQLFSTDAAHHQLSFGLARHWQSEGRQTAASLGWSAVWNRVATDISLTVTDGIANETALRRRIHAQASWIWNQRPVSLSVWRVDASGGRLLGIDRSDRMAGLNLSLSPRQGITLDLSHQETRSTITLFSERRTGLGVRFDLGR